MTPTIITKLKELKDRDFKVAASCATDAEIFRSLISNLPNTMPQPDIVFTKTSGLTSHDVVIQYFLRENESPEPLRMLLTMLFGAETWEATQIKATQQLAIQTIVFLADLTVLIMVGAGEDTYHYESKVDCGDYTLGDFSLKRFVPYDIVREYVESDFLGSSQISFGISTTILDWWGNLVDDLIAYIPVEFPTPDDIQGGYGGIYDVDLIYSSDYDGKLRGYITQFSNDLNWDLRWNKQAGMATLTSHFLLNTESRAIKIQTLIENPRLDVETLIFREESGDDILYQALRDDDPGFQQMLLEQLRGLDD